MRSFRAQRHHRINPGRAPRREVTGQQPRDNQEEADSQEVHRICGRDAMIAAKYVLPQRITEDDDPVASWPIFSRFKRAPDPGRRAEQSE